MPRVIKAVLFDIDDTLFDRQEAQIKCLDQIILAFPYLSRDCNRIALLEAWSESDRLSIAEFNAGSFDRAARCRHFLRLLGLASHNALELSLYFWQVFPYISSPMPGARELVAELAGRCRLGIISNSYPDIQHGKIKTLGLTDSLDCVVLSEELGIRKPDPAIFRHAAGILGIPVQECLFVGDSYSADIAGAKSAGMLACWFNRNKTPPPPHPLYTPDFSIESLSHLYSLLKGNDCFVLQIK